MGAKTNGMTERLHFVRDLWKKYNLINLKNGNNGIDVKTFRNLALLKFGLTELADGLHERYVNKALDDCGCDAMKSLSDLASIIFTKNDQARLVFLQREYVKYI